MSKLWFRRSRDEEAVIDTVVPLIVLGAGVVLVNDAAGVGDDVGEGDTFGCCECK